MMEQQDIVTRVRDLLDAVHFGVLATVDLQGNPRQRWMSPVFLPRFPDRIFAVTSERFTKIKEILANPRVSWMIQAPGLDCIATVTGTCMVVRDPMLSAEVLERIGPYLQVFWKFSGDPRSLVVLETVIEKATFFEPLAASAARRKQEL